MIDSFVQFARSILSDNWFAWFYQYLFGGLFFFSSLWLAVHAGTIYKGLRADRRIIWVLVVGFFLFAGLHLVWIFSVEGPPRQMSDSLHTIDYTVIVLYFAAIVACGIYFGRYTKSTADFFFGGQRFVWWLIAASCIATLVGSYSFINYSDRRL